jgi:hypothetical protein
MATVPGVALTNWIAGAGIAATNTTLGSHYVIPKASVQAYVGNDTVITDDIRDFLFSILSRCADSYSAAVGAGDTKTVDVIVSRVVTAGVGGIASFNVTLKDNTYAPPYISALGTYS